MGPCVKNKSNVLKWMLFSTVIILLCEIGWAMRIEIGTMKKDGIVPSSFTVTCTPEAKGDCGREGLALQLSRSDEGPLVTLKKGSEIVYNPLWENNLKAEGGIETDIGKSKLSVKLSHLLEEDSGQYSCVMLFLDRFGNFQEEKATDYITIEGHNVTDLVQQLLERTSSLEDSRNQEREHEQFRKNLLEERTFLEDMREELDKDGLGTIGNETLLGDDCPGQMYRDNCYLFVDLSFTVSKARQFCKAIGGFLAAPTTPGENNFMADVIEKKGRDVIWIGVSDEKQENTWLLDSGEEAKWTRWGGAEPNNYEPYGEDCVTLSEHGHWNDVHCGDILRGILCKKKM